MFESIKLPAVRQSLAELQAYQRQFAAYLRAPGNNTVSANSLPPGADIYSRLLFAKINGNLRHCFPVTHALLETGRWRQLVKEFISSHRCKSPLYREIPDEFIDFLLHGPRETDFSAFFVELAHYEWMELVLETADTVGEDPVAVAGTNLLDRIPVLNPVLHVLHYRYPVHRISAADPTWKSWQYRDEPSPQQAVILVGFRDGDFNVQFVEANGLTARLIELLAEGNYTGYEALVGLADEIGRNDRETFLNFGQEILHHLQAQQIIIGVRND